MLHPPLTTFAVGSSLIPKTLVTCTVLDPIPPPPLATWLPELTPLMLPLISCIATTLRHPAMLTYGGATVCVHLSSAARSDTKRCLLVLGKDLDYFSQAGFDMDRIQLKRNAPVAQLYEDAIRNEGAIISASGALINFSGKKTGRSPKDKRIVYEETSKDDIWWGSVNVKMDERE